MSKITDILEYLGESYYPQHEYNQIYADQNKQAVAEAAQAITDLISEAIDEAESLWHYEDGIEVAESMARDIRTKLGLTNKETN